MQADTDLQGLQLGLGGKGCLGDGGDVVLAQAKRRQGRGSLQKPRRHLRQDVEVQAPAQ